MLLFTRSHWIKWRPCPNVTLIGLWLSCCVLHALGCCRSVWCLCSASLNVRVLELPPFRFKARHPGQRLKIGYVSSDFGNHPLSHLCQSIFGLHDRSQFDVTCYALTPDDGSVWRRKIAEETEKFKDVSGLLNGELARAVNADGIHILINLNGYTKGARNEVFALQPAPIQASYMGYCGTMGADYIQYLIADRSVIPASSRYVCVSVVCAPAKCEVSVVWRRRRGYTESVVYMPHCYFVNDHKQSATSVLDPEKCPK
jgi:protein O-GlcNAc transferase